MVIGNVPKTAIIGTPTIWVTEAIPSYPSTAYDLIWYFDATRIAGTADPIGGGWITETHWDGATLGNCAFSLAVTNKATLVYSDIIEQGVIFLETPEYNMLRLQSEAADYAILKILQGGGNQSLSIKGRSSTKYGLAELQSLAKTARSQMARLLSGGAGGQLLVNFGGRISPY
jgi:hypothetical protein